MAEDTAGMAQKSHHFTSSMPEVPPDQQPALPRHQHRMHHHQQQPTPSDDDATHGHDELCRHDHDHSGLKNDHFHKAGAAEDDYNISIQAGSKHAEMAVGTFLSEHIPVQYNPIGAEDSRPPNEHDDAKSNTKFCYRHRPDVKCRRQANEPSMEQLQNELASLSQSDQQAISHVWSLFSAAPAKHRNLMLQGILTQCCFPQLSFISASVRDLIKIDFVSALPDELAFNILCYLDTASLCKAAQVSQRWRTIADDDVVWHKMCEQHIDRKCTKCGWGLPLMDRKRLRLEKRKIQFRARGRGLNQWSPDITPAPEEIPASTGSFDQSVAVRTQLKRPLDDDSNAVEAVKKQCSSSLQSGYVGVQGNDAYFAPRKRPWKDVYKDRYKVGTAWKHGRCTTKVFRGHTNGVMCLQFDDNILMTGSYDTTVKIWDINTGEEIRTLTGHLSGIRCLQFDEKKLMTGSLDSTLKLWDWKTGTLLRSFDNAHSEGIISLHFTENYVATGSRDRTIRIWDSKANLTFKLEGHSDWVNSVKIDQESRTVFSASDDLTVKLWDLDKKECIRTFGGHVGQVQQVVPMPAEFNLDGLQFGPEQDDDASSESSITFSSSHQERLDQQSNQHFWPDDPDRPAPPRYMLTGALDATIRLWDTHSKSTQPAREPSPQADTGFVIIPTDPLTNSHTPRAPACVRTFFGHVEGIWALAADHLRLISGSQDSMMKVWDPRTGKCERTFTGHQGPVTCAWLSDNRVASGSEDCDVRMLCFGDNE